MLGAKDDDEQGKAKDNEYDLAWIEQHRKEKKQEDGGHTATVTTTERDGKTSVFKSFDYDVEMVRNYLRVCGGTINKPSLAMMQTFAPPELKYDPQTWHEFLEEEDWDYKVKVFRAAGLKLEYLEGLREVKIRDLDPFMIDELIELEVCKVISLSNTKPVQTVKRFICLNCDNNTWDIPSTSIKANRKQRCRNEPSHRVMEDNDIDPRKDYINSQFLKLQELRTEQGHLPSVIPALLKGKDMVWQVKTYERIKPKGFLRVEEERNTRKGTMEPKYWFEIVSIKKLDRETTVKLTEEDKKYIRNQMRLPGFYEKLLASFAPHIYGMRAMKECCILVLGSQKLPHPAKVLVVTDPGMAKSEISMYMADISENGHYSDMAKASSAGLTVTVESDKETGRWGIIPGAFPSAHEGVLCLDEAQQGSQDVFASINTAIEGRKVVYDKAGVSGELPAACAVLITANPYEGKILAEERITELLKYMGKNVYQTLSRMTLVYFMKDNLPREEEEGKARHMVRNSEKEPLEKFEENWYDDTKEEVVYDNLPPITNEFLDNITIKAGSIKTTFPRAERFGTRMLRKIFHYITNYVDIEPIPEELHQRLIDYYLENRSDAVLSTSKIVNTRFMRHAIVLTQIKARIEGRSKATLQDVDYILDLLNRNMSVTAFDPKTGEIDPNVLNNTLPQATIDKMAKQEQLIEAIERASVTEDGKTKKKYWTVPEVLYELDNMKKQGITVKWKSETEIERAINQMHNHGKIMETGGSGRFVMVD